MRERERVKFSEKGEKEDSAKEEKRETEEEEKRSLWDEMEFVGCSSRDKKRLFFAITTSPCVRACVVLTHRI